MDHAFVLAATTFLYFLRVKVTQLETVHGDASLSSKRVEIVVEKNQKLNTKIMK